MNISYLVTCKNEMTTLADLLNKLVVNLSSADEIVVLIHNVCVLGNDVRLTRPNVRLQL